MKDAADASDLALRITRLQTAYARALDADDLEAWPGFFTDDAFYSVTSAENHRSGLEAGLIWLDGNGMIRDRVTALRDANIYERHAYRHIIGQPFVTEEDDGEVSCETSFLVMRITRDGPTDVFATGSYFDRIRDTGDGPKFARRVVVCDSSHVDTLLGLPL